MFLSTVLHLSLPAVMHSDFFAHVVVMEPSAGAIAAAGFRIGTFGSRIQN